MNTILEKKKYLTYTETVMVFFLATYQVGISISSRDIELIRRWEKRQLPAQVVMRGIEQAIKNLAEPNRKLCLGDCISKVEAEARRYFKRCLSQPDEFSPKPESKPSTTTKEIGADPQDQNNDDSDSGALPGDDLGNRLLKRITETSDTLAIQVLRRSYKKATQLSKASLDDFAWFEAVELLNQQMFDDYYNALPGPDREEIDCAVRASTSGTLMSQETLQEFIIARRMKIIRDQYGLKHIFG